MPTWKKVVISGSGVAQLSNDANYLAQSGTGAILTGSFDGFFTGDGSGLTGVTAAGTLSSSAQIASDISGAFTAPSQSIATDISALQTFSSSLDSTFTSEAELNASSSTLQTNIDGVQTNLDSVSSSLASDKADITELNASSSTLQTNIDGVQTNLDTASGSLATRITTIEDDNATQTELDAVSSSLAASIAGLDGDFATDAELNASSSTLQTNIDGVQTNLDTASGSLATRLATIEGDNATDTELNASSSALTTAYTAADTTLSASLATSIAANAANLSNLTSGELNSGSFNVSLHPDSGSIAFTEGLEIGDVYDQGNGTTDIRVPAGASWLELNYADSDFIYLDGTNAGIQIDNGGGAIEWTYYGDSGLLDAPGEIRIPAANVFSGSVSGPTVTATTINGTTINGTTINGTINADNGVVSSSAQTIANLPSGTVSSSAQTVANLGGTSIVSSSAQTVANLNNQDVDFGSGDITATEGTFTGDVRIEGALTTTGTVTNINTTDLNVEDKFILLNSGSSAGNGGLIVQNSATVGQGTSLFFDDTADRWGLDFAGADATADTATADAYVAAVVETDDANYQKNGNIRIDTGTGEAFIYVA